MSGHKPKLLSDIPAELDILITMGCNVECPLFPINRERLGDLMILQEDRLKILEKQVNYRRKSKELILR